jgi:hypothetical protein
MTAAELLALLDDLNRLLHETEWVEFKNVKQGYDSDVLGRLALQAYQPVYSPLQ